MTRTDLHRCYSPISFTVIRNYALQHPECSAIMRIID
ncbi:antirestriction protein [Escherichia coli]